MIIQGDALKLIPALEDGSVQLVVTSPPYPGQYGNTMRPYQWLTWTEKWSKLLYPKLTANGVLVLVVMFKRKDSGWFDSSIFRAAPLMNYKLLDIYIYGKANPPPNGPLTYCDSPGWEFVFVLTKADSPADVIFNPVRKPYAAKSIRKANGKIYSNMSSRETEPHPEGARQTTLMIMSKSADQNRPSAKGISFPRALPERFIRQYTNPDDLVVDPFCGVGTTVRVAQELCRRGIGFEIDPEEAAKARAWLDEPWQERIVV